MPDKQHVNINSVQHIKKKRNLVVGFCSKYAAAGVWAILLIGPFIILVKGHIENEQIFKELFISISVYAPFLLTVTLIAVRLFGKTGIKENPCPIPILIIPLYAFFLYLDNKLTFISIIAIFPEEIDPKYLLKLVAALFVYVRLYFIESEKWSILNFFKKSELLINYLGMFKELVHSWRRLLAYSGKKMRETLPSEIKYFVDENISRQNLEKIIKAFMMAVDTISLLPDDAPDDLFNTAKKYCCCVRISDVDYGSKFMELFFRKLLKLHADEFVTLQEKGCILFTENSYEEAFAKLKEIIKWLQNAKANSLKASLVFK